MAKSIDYSLVGNMFDAMMTETYNGQTMAQFAGGGFPWPIAVHFAGLLEEHAGLLPNSHILDIGCGCGRIAAALTMHLSPEGRYFGVDLVSALTDFGNRHISPRYPNFKFLVHDQENSSYDKYKSAGKSETIPSIDQHFEAGSMDIILATSLFTHLTTDGAREIIRSIAHTMKQDGCALVTAFIMEAGTRALIERGPSIFKFKHKLEENVLMENRDEPLGAVAFKFNHMVSLLLEAGLYIERWLPGSWSGRAHTVSGQDVLIIRKI